MKRKIFILFVLLIVVVAGIGYTLFPHPTKVIKMPNQNGLTIQGACKVGDHILVSAYEPDRRIMIFDLDGKYISKSILHSQSHLGAICAYENQLYVPGVARQNRDIWGGFNLSEYPDGTKFPQIQRFDFNQVLQSTNNLFPNANLTFYDEYEWLFSHASEADNCIFSEMDIHDFNGEMSIIGCNYNKKGGTHLVILPIDSVNYNRIISTFDNTNAYLFDSSRVKCYKVPINRVQGVCMLGNGTFLFTQTNGNWMPSKLFHGKIDGDSIKILGSVNLPPHAEQVSVYDNKHIMVSFERSKDKVESMISKNKVYIYRYKDLNFK